MWESPIEIICNDIQYKVVDEYEKQIINAIQSYGISVNKEELVKALNYDRQQYEKGYADAKAEYPWIPVTDRPPEKNGNYLVTVEDDVFDEPFVMTLWYGIPNNPFAKRRDWYMSDQDGEFYFDGVTAWMELPKAHKGVEA